MHRFTLQLGYATVALLLAACGGRSNLNPGGLGSGGGGVGGAGPAQGVGGSGQVTSSVGASSPNGSGGAGSGVTNGSGAGPSSGVGPGSSVSSTTTTTNGSGPGTTGPGGGPIDCFQCIGQECPEALQCIQDPTCMQGILCTVSQCLSGGQPDFGCFLGCFNGDFQAAIQAFQSLSCVMGNCEDECGGLLGG
jgi:hypothetical protein